MNIRAVIVINDNIILRDCGVFPDKLDGYRAAFCYKQYDMHADKFLDAYTALTKAARKCALDNGYRAFSPRNKPVPGLPKMRSSYGYQKSGQRFWSYLHADQKVIGIQWDIGKL